jgi:HlyD family secretion protein
MTKTSNSSTYIKWTAIKRGDVTETISASGTVQASNQVTLNLPGGGGDRITSINVQVGDHVKKGQILATIDDHSARTQLENAQANLMSAEAHLTQLKKGTTTEDIAMQRADLNKAAAALDSTKGDFQVQQATYQVQKQKSNFDK